MSTQQAAVSPEIRGLDLKTVSDTNWLCDVGKLTQPL